MTVAAAPRLPCRRRTALVCRSWPCWTGVHPRNRRRPRQSPISALLLRPHQSRILGALLRELRRGTTPRRPLLHELRAGMTPCPLTVTCATCGNEEPEGSQFCGSCGAAFVPADSSQPIRHAPGRCWSAELRQRGAGGLVSSAAAAARRSHPCPCPCPNRPRRRSPRWSSSRRPKLNRHLLRAERAAALGRRRSGGRVARGGQRGRRCAAHGRRFARGCLRRAAAGAAGRRVEP